MNPFLKNLNKIEFVITYACTGRCKHCSQGDHTDCGTHISPEFGAEIVKKIVANYKIHTVMTFGGEPLLHADSVFSIMAAAKEMKVPKRQLITNGYFSKDTLRIKEVVKSLAECGVNDLLLSVDAFHQETIPIDTIKIFAEESQNAGIPMRLQPAWLVSYTDDNPYNRKTRELLDSFQHMEISENEGNIIFPEGNAIKYLSEYFKANLPENPYIENPTDLRCLSFDPDGSVLGENAHYKDIMEIIENYRP